MKNGYTQADPYRLRELRRKERAKKAQRRAIKNTHKKNL